MYGTKYNNVPTYMGTRYIPLRGKAYYGRRRRIGVTKTLARRGPGRRRINLPYQTHNPLHELKFFDSNHEDTLVSTSGTILTSVNLVPQGNNESDREGRRILIQSFMAYWEVSLPLRTDQADIQSGDIIRIMVLIDHQANGASPIVTDILETAQLNSFRNLAHTKRFTVIMDKRLAINRFVAATDGTNTSTTPNILKFCRIFKKLNLPIHFDGTAGIFSEITENNILFLYISSQGLVSVSDQKTRIRYFG